MDRDKNFPLCSTVQDKIMVRQKIFGGAEQQASKLFFTRLMELIFVGSKLLLQLKKKKKRLE